MTDSTTLSELSDPLMPCFVQRFCKDPLTAISCQWAMNQLEGSDFIGVYLNEVTDGWFVERIYIPFFLQRFLLYSSLVRSFALYHQYAG